MAKRLVVFLVFLAVGLAGIKLTLHLYLDKKVNLQQSTIVQVAKGSGLSSIAWQLNKKNIIDYPRLFVKVGQLEGYSKNIKYGEYLIESGDSYKKIFQKITSGDNFKYEITFVEGDHLYKYARQVAEKGLGSEKEFLATVKNQQFIMSLLGERVKTLEGYLFPETYFFSKSDGVKTIVKAMVGNFLKQSKKIDFKSVGMSRHEVVTLASIIEKETGAAHERPLISSVFHNRLKKKMRLQTDPTILYGMMDKTGKEVNNIRKKDILAPTIYNTYVIKGLPPGPISNPGLASLQAAVKPASSEYLYFVSQNDGTHIFTTNYKDHQKAVNKYQKDPKMRKGKSWRDLKKKK